MSTWHIRVLEWSLELAAHREVCLVSFKHTKSSVLSAYNTPRNHPVSLQLTKVYSSNCIRLVLLLYILLNLVLLWSKARGLQAWHISCCDRRWISLLWDLPTTQETHGSWHVWDKPWSPLPSPPPGWSVLLEVNLGLDKRTFDGNEDCGGGLTEEVGDGRDVQVPAVGSGHVKVLTWLHSLHESFFF